MRTSARGAPGRTPFRAAGLMAASLRIDDAQTVLRPLVGGLIPELLDWYRSARQRLVAQLREDGIPRSRIRAVASADCRYEGQGYELELPLAAVSPAGIAGLAPSFHGRHPAGPGQGVRPTGARRRLPPRAAPGRERDRRASDRRPDGFDGGHRATSDREGRRGREPVAPGGARGARGS